MMCNEGMIDYDKHEHMRNEKGRVNNSEKVEL